MERLALACLILLAVAGCFRGPDRHWARWNGEPFERLEFDRDVFECQQYATLPPQPYVAPDPDAGAFEKGLARGSIAGALAGRWDEYTFQRCMTVRGWRLVSFAP